MRDIHNSIKRICAIAPQVVGTTGAAGGVTSNIIDRRGYGSVEFTYNHGTAGATGDTTTPVVFECDTTGGSFTSVADADLIGTEAAAGLPAQATARTSGVGKNVAKSLGYKGIKPFLKTKLYGLGHATGIVSATCDLGNPIHNPVA